MNQNKQRALFFTVLIIVYTLFDYFFLRGHPAEDSSDIPPVAERVRCGERAGVGNTVIMTRVINFKLTHSAVQTAASGHERPAAGKTCRAGSD